MTTITVNGRVSTVDVPPATPLLYVLRNDLRLDGPRLGCGLGQCGACTVHLDGEAVRSCLLPVGALAGRTITTLEGLGTAESPHPVAAAFVAEQAAQCGYCLSGWIMTTAALVAREPGAPDAALRRGLAGLKCRCGTHLAFLRAARRAADQAVVTAPLPS